MRATRAQDKPCNLGDPIKKHSKVRLQHGPTRKWLHSHQYQSPLSGNQEVRTQLLLQAWTAYCWYKPTIADVVIQSAWVALHMPLARATYSCCL